MEEGDSHPCSLGCSFKVQMWSWTLCHLPVPCLLGGTWQTVRVRKGGEPRSPHILQTRKPRLGEVASLRWQGFPSPRWLCIGRDEAGPYGVSDPCANS